MNQPVVMEGTEELAGCGRGSRGVSWLWQRKQRNQVVVVKETEKNAGCGRINGEIRRLWQRKQRNSQVVWQNKQRSQLVLVEETEKTGGCGRGKKEIGQFLRIYIIKLLRVQILLENNLFLVAEMNCQAFILVIQRVPTINIELKNFS